MPILAANRSLEQMLEPTPPSGGSALLVLLPWLQRC